MKERIAEIESVLLRSGIAAYLPEEVKFQVCHSVAIDLDNLMEEAVRNAPLPQSIQEALNSGDGVYRP